MRYQRYRGRLVPFSSFARPDSFPAVRRASGSVIMFSAPKHVFGGSEGVGSRFHVLRARTRFRPYRGCRVPFSYFVLPDSFFGGAMCVGSHFHVLHAQNRFRRYRGRRVPFLSFARPDSFSAVSGRRVPFSCFARPDSFSALPRAYGPVSCFALADSFPAVPGSRVPFSCFSLPESFSAVPGASGPIFNFCAPGLVFGVTVGVGSRYHVLRVRTRFRRYRGCKVPFSYFALSDSFSVVPRASGRVFMF
jgi:hypothetical protein